MSSAAVMIGALRVKHYCICVAGGTYNDVEGIEEASDCKPCSTRKYCPEGSETDGIECPAGFYCVAGQASGYMKPCPVGTYSNTPGLNGKTLRIM